MGLNESAKLIRQATVTVKRWVANVEAHKYADPLQTRVGQALLALEREAKAPAPVPAPVPPPPAANPIPLAFQGRGMLATWNTESVFRDLAPYLDWIALLGRLPDTTKGLADEIRADGKGPRVLVWEDENSNEGQAVVARIGAAGYLGQGESQAQHDAKLQLGPELEAAGTPKGLIDGVSYLPITHDQDGHPNAWPNNWVCFPECYEAANPMQTVANMVYEAKVNRGAKTIVPVFQLYVEGSQQPVYLDRYLNECKVVPEVAHGSWCGFSLLTEDGRPHDMDVLRALGPVVR